MKFMIMAVALMAVVAVGCTKVKAEPTTDSAVVAPVAPTTPSTDSAVVQPVAPVTPEATAAK